MKREARDKEGKERISKEEKDRNQRSEARNYESSNVLKERQMN